MKVYRIINDREVEITPQISEVIYNTGERQ
jgi:hypothetical protein